MKSVLAALILFVPFWSKAQWKAIYTPTLANGAFSAPSDSNLFYSYDAKTMYYSHDGGLKWNHFITEYDSEFIQDMDFVNDSVGFACGGGWFTPHRNIVLRTTNAGKSWETLTRDSVGKYQFLFEKIDFVNIDSGMVLGYSYDLYRTTDAGSTWQQVNYDTVVNNNQVSDIYFYNGSLGFLTTIGGSAPLRKGRIYRTTDFGNTWVIVKEWDYSGSFIKAHFVNERVGYVGGNFGKLFKTTDGGTTWAETTIPPGNVISALWFTDENTGYSNALGTIYKTTDGGASWNPQMMSPLNIVSDIQFSPSGNTGFLLAGNFLYKTTNGGGTTTINNPALKSQFKIYPNPTNNIINLDYENSLKIQGIQLIDLSGKGIRTYSKSDRVLNVSGLSSGVYFLVIRTEQGSVYEKILIN
ncbi:MAG: T9SS type A sorting domain-containing protein [Bacteroidetes bacterium]|nr:T9SS type A sorting domain-containing protein [Bacteroidota bacterium]